MDNLECGIRSFRRRLAFGIRDTVLERLNNPKSISLMSGLPLGELGPIADLNEQDRAALVRIVAEGLDAGITHFLHGLENQADGFEVHYNGALLNDEAMLYLNDSKLPSLASESRFDHQGRPRQSESK